MSAIRNVRTGASPAPTGSVYAGRPQIRRAAWLVSVTSGPAVTRGGVRSSAAAPMSFARKEREERLVDPSPIGLRHRTDDALTSEAGALEYPLGRRVPDVHERGHTLDPE